MRRIFLAGAALVLGLGTLTACGGDKANEPYKDAPRDGANNDPAMIIEMPDGFSNLATKCVSGVRYTVAYKGDDNRASVTTVLDPGCK
jgi:hypothetical protein